MATTTFYIKQNDTAPSIQGTLKDGNNRVRSLTSASAVRFNMKDENGNIMVDNANCVIVNASSGIVRYDWQVGDTTSIGINYCEFEVTYLNGQIETFPNGSDLKVIIKEEIA